MSQLEPRSEPKPRPSRRRLVLASRSPRRRRLLDEAGLSHEVCEPGVDDALLAAPAGPLAAAWVRALAYLKARAAAERLGVDDPTVVLLAADTVVVKGDVILIQPRDEADAERIVRTLSGGGHRVLTGVALLDPETGARRLLHDSAHVEVGPLTGAQIDQYLASGLWRGKAGAYNLSERIEAGWPIRYSGDPGTIMGLPMRVLTPILQELLSGG